MTLDRSRLLAAGLALAAVLLLAVNVFAGTVFRGWRLDLTEDRLYTISDGTREVLKGLEEPITLRLYFSEILGRTSPPHAAYYARVRELLEQYADLADGMIRLEIHRPEPFSDDEDRAVAFGLQGIPVNSAGDLGYFGLAGTNSTDGEAVIPFFSPEREPFLEYDLTKLVYTLANPEKKVVGVISTLPVDGGMPSPMGPAMGMQRPWVVMDQIREFFEVRTLGRDVESIPDDVDVLMLVHPRDLAPRTLYAIDQFVLGGGKALVFLDANAETAALSGPAGMALAGRSEIDDLLAAWGARLVKDKVAGDLDAARRVNAGTQGRAVIADYVAWLTLGRDRFDPKDVVTADIDRLTFATPGILEKVDGATTEFRPLVTTGPRAMAIDAGKVRFSPDVVALYRAFVPGGEPLTLAARLSGPAKTAYPDGPPRDDGDEDGKADGDGSDEADAEKAADAALAAAGLKESKGPINVLVVADADMLYDKFWVRTQDFFGQRILVPDADNGAFVVNALDNLSGSSALIQLRGRGRSDRPFTFVDNIRREAERRYRDKEQALLDQLKELQDKLDQVSKGGGEAGAALLTPEERKAIETFRTQMLAVRRELREVQRALRRDIERVDGWFKFLNIAAVPLVIAAAAGGVALYRRRRRHPARPAGEASA